MRHQPHKSVKPGHWNPHGGVCMAGGGRVVQLEGKARPRNGVARLPSVEAAVDCYHSPEYQEALSHARNASERELMVVEITE